MAIALMVIGSGLLVSAAALVALPLALATGGALLLAAGIDLARGPRQ